MLETTLKGRYQILERLGQGGMGAVYKAEDTVQHRPVAVKIVDGENMDGESLARFKREGQSMRDLSYPNIVNVLDMGREGSTYFLVMEYIDGQSLKDFLTVQPDHRLPMELALDLTRQIARALEYVHANDILHRDIKPANIMISEDHQAKLADFGVAKSLGLTTLTQTGDIVGTAAYMAPEQALGETFDARSDLYALGCVLYEMLAGQRLFPGTNPARLIFSHINDTPTLPRRLAIEISPHLEAMLFKLLAKSPEDRFQNASELLLAFDELDRQSAPEAVAMQRVEKRWAQILIGREEELSLLKGRLDEAIAHQGGMIFLSGETGIGKTRLVHQVATYASMRGARVYEGRAHHQMRSGAYQPWLEILRGAFRLSPSPFIEKVPADHLHELAKLDPSLGQKLPQGPRADDVPQGQQQERLFNAITQFLIHLSEESPLLLFLDDLHWADETSMLLLEYMATQIGAARILILGAYRGDELKSQRYCADIVARTLRQPTVEELSIKRLDQEETAEMIRKSLSGQEFHVLEGLVYEKTEGNPYFIEELLRTLLDSGHVTLVEGHWSVKDLTHIEIPEGIRSVVENRLSEFGEENLELLSVAALTGREFDFDTLQAVLEIDEARLVEVIDDALQTRVLEAKPQAMEETYAFREAAVREVLYESISPVRRPRLHKKIGTALERIHADHLIDFAESLSHHFKEGHEEGKAATYSEKAGDKAVAVYAWKEAIKYYQLALELLPREQMEVRARIHQKLAPALSLENPQASLDHALSALDLYLQLDDKRKMIDMHMFIQGLHMGGFWEGARDDEALKHLQAATALAEEFPDSREQGLMYQRSAHLLLHHSQPQESLAYAQSAVDLYERLGIELGTSKGTALAYMGQIDEGLAYSEGNYGIVQQAEYPLVMGLFGHELCLTLALARDIARAKKWGAELLPKLESAGAFFEGFVLRPLVLTYTLSGEAQKGKDAVQRELEIEQETLTGCYLEDTMGIGLYYLRSGELDQAKAYLETAIERHEKRSTLSAVSGCRFALGSLYLEEGKFEQAEEMLRWSLQSCQAGGNALFELWVLPILIETYLKTGDMDNARRGIERASELLSPDRNWYALPGPVNIAKGMLAALQKGWDDAERYFSKALEINRKFRIPWDEAKALYQWGKMDALRKDKSSAEEKFTQAEGIFQRIGAKRDAQKASSAKEDLGRSWFSRLKK